MSTNEPIYDWAIVGGGVAGIALSEILTREGHSVVLLERNNQLASETTRDFHEWIHMGSLYTLIPDKLLTLKFLLGAIDDLLEYYGGFPGMNLVPTERGMAMRDAEDAWFSENYIHFRFRIAGRKITIPWLLGVARSMFLIDRIKNHDWLRRRGGVLDPFRLRASEIARSLYHLLRFPGRFYDYATPDFTTNSRNLLRSLLHAARRNGLRTSIGNEFVEYRKEGADFVVCGRREQLRVRNIVFTNGENLVNHVPAQLKVSYAPMAVVDNVSRDTRSFVELDYFPRNCINILTKGDGVALIGGISFSNLDACGPYIEQVIARHREYNPQLRVLHRYVGRKSEIVLRHQEERNYLYHILNIEPNVWGVIPGKFTLAFSVAPEFYRRVYMRNPRKAHDAVPASTIPILDVAETVWHDVVYPTRTPSRENT